MTLQNSTRIHVNDNWCYNKEILNMEVETKIMEDDPIKIIQILGALLTQFYFTKIVSYIVCILSCIFILVQTYFFIDIFEVRYFVKYSPLYFASIYGLVSLIYALIAESEIRKKKRKLKPYWSFDFVGLKTESNILRSVKFWILLCLINLAISICTGLLFAVVGLENAGELFYPIKYFLKYYPAFVKYVHLIYILLVSYYGISMLSFIFLMIHVIIHQIYQIQMFNIYLQHITQEYEEYNINFLRDDRHYQQIVYNKLILIIKKHIKIYKCMVIINKLMQGPIVAFSISGTLMGLGVILDVFAAVHILGVTCLVGLTITFIVNFFMFIHSGELIYDEMNKTYDISKNVLWYTWNKENRRLYQIFLTRAIKPTRLAFSDNMVFNYLLGVQMVKSLYSISLLMARFQ